MSIVCSISLRNYGNADLSMPAKLRLAGILKLAKVKITCLFLLRLIFDDAQEIHEAARKGDEDDGKC